MLDAPDDAMGQTAPCPNCQTEISVPMVASPAKQRIVMSRNAGEVLAAMRQARQRSHSGTWLALFAGIILGIFIGDLTPLKFSALLSKDSRLTAFIKTLIQSGAPATDSGAEQPAGTEKHE